MTVYACGLRVSEARDLKTSDIDELACSYEYAMARVRRGASCPLSKRLLKELVDYWRAQRQAKAGHGQSVALPWAKEQVSR